MEHLPRTRLLEHHGGRHFVSEPHVRIQVLPVPVRSGDGEALFANHHGEVLVHCLAGTCVVRTALDHVELAGGDQVLLVDGEPFRIDRVEGQEGVVQLIWTPGMNPCRTCWERDGKFFEKA
jgi:homogentisate 1,2-dioxygenase